MSCYDRWTKAQLVDYYVKMADNLADYRDAAAYRLILDCVNKALGWLEEVAA